MRVGRFGLIFGVLLGFLALAGSAAADTRIGTFFFRQRRYHEALRELMPLAGKKDATATYLVGVMLCRGQGCLADRQTGYRFLRLAASQGMKDAAFLLALEFAKGTRAGEDAVEARRMFTQLANQGYTPAMSHLAFMLSNGEGGSRDYRGAWKWFITAAKRGDTVSLYTLGLWHYHGAAPGLEIDYETARGYFQRAAERGSANAWYWLGLIHENGCGVPQDRQKALELFRRGVEAGSAYCLMTYGSLYETGDRVERDLIKAAAYYTVGKQDEGGREIDFSLRRRAVKRLELLLSRMTDAQKQQVNTLSREILGKQQMPLSSAP
jgi:hypothetical protein